MSGDLPTWGQALKLRQLLWQKYGVAFTDIQPGDLLGIILLEEAEARRGEAS